MCHNFLFFYKKFANTLAPTTVSIPATAIERLLIAPSISPISIALAVPTACADVPIATPLAIGSVILNTLHINSANILPITPVTTITATVIVTYPPSSSDTPYQLQL